MRLLALLSLSVKSMHSIIPGLHKDPPVRLMKTQNTARKQTQSQTVTKTDDHRAPTNPSVFENNFLNRFLGEIKPGKMTNTERQHAKLCVNLAIEN